MSIEPIPVWSLYPDWKDGLTETWEFLTSVGESAAAIEQRRGLRLTPRQYFEYSYVLQGPERTYFDLLTMRSGGSFCYLPLWHDVELLQVEHIAGMTALGINTTYTEFMNCDAVFLGSTHDYELVEIVGRADTVVTLTSPLINTWPARTRVAPMKKVKLDQQPSTTRRSELVHNARVKFCSVENNRSDAENPLNLFGLQYVLEHDPNEVTDLTYNYERLLSSLDNQTGLPTLSDVTGKMLQQFSWWLRGREALHQFRGMMYALDGRRVPVWVPTVYSDFEPIGPLGAADVLIDVKRCGFTNLGGPGPQREYILIHLQNGTRIYRKITNSVILGDGSTERLFLDAAIGIDISPTQLRRISFLVLCRLDQDSIELTHHTATRGMTTATVVFRSAAAKPGIENIYEVPPGTAPETICLSDMTWYLGSPSLTTATKGGLIATQLDAFGNVYATQGSSGRSVSIYNPNGVLLNVYTDTQLFDAINAWAGYDIVQWYRYNGIWVTPIRQGQYVLACVVTNNEVHNFNKWWVLLEPAVDGSLTVRGAVYMQNFNGPPYSNLSRILDVFDDDTCLTVLAWAYLGATYATMLMLPPISAFLDNTYGGGAHPCRIPTKTLEPLGNVAGLSQNLYVLVPDNQNRNFGFRLPGNGRELFYIYINRDYMDVCLASSLYRPPEIRNVIAPVYPYGAMLKIPLGDISDFDALPAYRPTENYVIDNPSWLDGDGGVTIPFSEEWTYLSTGLPGGGDVFSSLVGVQKRTNGHFWVIFVMTGQYDASFRGGAGAHAAMPVYAKVRLFDYDPATEIGRQIGDHTCPLRTTGDGPDEFKATLQDDLYLIPTVIELPGSATVVLNGLLYRTTFCKFFFAEEA